MTPNTTEDTEDTVFMLQWWDIPHSGPPGMPDAVPFDFGYVDPVTGEIIHANLEYNPRDPATGQLKYFPQEREFPKPNYFYKSTPAQWGYTGKYPNGKTWYGYRDFNKEVWCVQCPGSIYGKKLLPPVTRPSHAVPSLGG